MASEELVPSLGLTNCEGRKTGTCQDASGKRRGELSEVNNRKR